MAIEVKLPDLGDGIESGDVLDVLVSEGDQVEKDQGIIEIETEKATVEVPSPQAGTVTKLLVATGDTLAIGAPILTLEPAGASAAPGPASESAPESEASSAAAAAPAEPAAQPAAADATVPPPSASPPVASAPAQAAPAKTPSPATAATPQPPISSATQVAPAGPAIRRLAREVGVDLNTVSGSGPSGRITREDVMAVVRQGNVRPSKTTPVKTAPAKTAPAEAESINAPPTAAEPSLGEPSTDDWGPVEIERASRIRRTIAAKMTESWETVPRVTNFDDADVTELERIRQKSKADYAAAGVKLTSLPFVIKAVALALRQHPLLNASLNLEQEQIIYKKYFNIGIAVDTDRGLVVPSLRQAEQLSISEVARRLGAISEAARTNSFSLEDLRGSTFTISNLGAIGGTYSTPIINTPEVAILLVGRSRRMPVVVDDEVAIRLMMPMSLSYDHRLVDGGAAARFLNDVIGYLEAPSRLFLAP